MPQPLALDINRAVTTVTGGDSNGLMYVRLSCTACSAASSGNIALMPTSAGVDRLKIVDRRVTAWIERMGGNEA